MLGVSRSLLLRALAAKRNSGGSEAPAIEALARRIASPRRMFGSSWLWDRGDAESSLSLMESSGGRSGWKISLNPDIANLPLEELRRISDKAIPDDKRRESLLMRYGAIAASRGEGIEKITRDEDQRPLSLRYIGSRMGVSHQRVSTLIKEAEKGILEYLAEITTPGTSSG